MESMMTVRQVAELLGVHENWVYDQAASGGLPSYKIGGSRRFDPDELRSWIAQHHEPDNGRQHPPARRATTASAARRRAQHEQRQTEAEQSSSASRRSDAETKRKDHDPQPRLFEI